LIGQLPPFAIATPTFRFRALASNAGRASLGGDREIGLACFAIARLGAGMLPPVTLAPPDAAARAASVRHWLSSISLSAPARSAAIAVIDAMAGGERRASAKALRELASLVAAHLDAASAGEMRDLADELAA
jgi:hypothetical protein